VSLFKRINTEHFGSASEFFFAYDRFLILIWPKNLWKESRQHWVSGAGPPVGPPVGRLPRCPAGRHAGPGGHGPAPSLRGTERHCRQAKCCVRYYVTVLGRLLAACRGAQLAATLVLEATALLRLYAALRGIAGKPNILLYVAVLRLHDILARIWHWPPPWC
jgi:hypothetical protein